VRLRAATAADLPRLAAWNHELIEDQGADTKLGLAGLEVRMRRWLAGDYRAVMFEAETGPAGYALYRVDQDGVQLRQRYVARPLRRRGIGREAVRRLLAEEFPRATRVWLQVLEQNAVGLAFWRALGFRPHARALLAPAESETR
jgi:ribosomal protein S18 acetylase RimI-like enzyme